MKNVVMISRRRRTPTRTDECIMVDLWYSLQKFLYYIEWMRPISYTTLSS